MKPIDIYRKNEYIDCGSQIAILVVYILDIAASLHLDF